MASNIKSSQIQSLSNWEIFTLEDAYRLRPPIKYAVNNLIEVPSLNIVYGAPGSLKSMVMADLGCCVAKGANWLESSTGGGNSFQVTKCGILWLDFDNGKRRTHDRFGAFGRAHNLPVEANFKYVSVPNPWLDAGDKNQILELAELVKQLDVELVIIDNLAAISGKANENTSEIFQILAHLRWVTEETGAAVIVIHHARKTFSAGGRKGDSLRGHNSIEGAVDNVLLVNRKDLKSDTITIESTKARGAVIPLISASLDYTSDKHGQLATAKFVSGNKYELEVSDEINKAIMACLREKPMNQSQLVDNVQKKVGPRISLRRIKDEITSSVDNGSITETRGTRNAKVFTISSPRQLKSDLNKSKQV